MVGFVVSRHGGTSLYVQVAMALRARIIQGEFPPGSSLPAENDLGVEYNVGRDSIRQAMAVLRAEGLIETRRGFRSTVREPQLRTTIEIGSGTRVGARMPTAEERAEHDMPAGVPMLVLGETPYPADRFDGLVA